MHWPCRAQVIRKKFKQAMCGSEWAEDGLAILPTSPLRIALSFCARRLSPQNARADVLDLRASNNVVAVQTASNARCKDDDLPEAKRDGREQQAVEPGR